MHCISRNNGGAYFLLPLHSSSVCHDYAGTASGSKWVSVHAFSRQKYKYVCMCTQFLIMVRSYHASICIGCLRSTQSLSIVLPCFFFFPVPYMNTAHGMKRINLGRSNAHTVVFTLQLVSCRHNIGFYTYIRARPTATQCGYLERLCTPAVLMMYFNP